MPSVVGRRGRDAPRHRGQVRADARRSSTRSASPRRSTCPSTRSRDKLKRRRRFAWLKRRVSEDEVQDVRELSRSRRSATRCDGLDDRGRGAPLLPEPRARRAAARLRRRPTATGKEGLELVARARAQGPRLRGARPARSLGPPALLRGRRGRAGARRAQRLPHDRQGHPVHRRARARGGDQDLRGDRRLDRRRGSRRRARSSRWRARPATTRTTTARPIPTRAATAPSPIASSPARR